jgi:hypothetical protein
MRDINVVTDVYLKTLYKLRLDFCSRRSKELYELLGSAKGEERQDIKLELDKLDYYSQNVRKKYDKL